MFEYLIKNSKLYKKLQQDLKNEKQWSTNWLSELDDCAKERIRFNKTIVDLETELKSLNSAGGASIKEGNSSVIFEFDDKLAITVKSRINEDIITELIDKKYINAEHAADEATVQFAFILLANEATEQIIIGVNNDED